MKLYDAIRKIEKYIASTNATPIIVDLQNGNDFDEIKAHFSVGNNTFIATSDYCKNDENPRLETLFDVMLRKEETIFLTELSTFLKLEGEHELRNRIKSILGFSIIGHVIVFTYQCKSYLTFSDPRLTATSRIIIVDGEEDITPKIIFAAKELPMPDAADSYSGIHEIAKAVEKSCAECVYIQTTKKKTNYPMSVLTISNLSKAYEVLIMKDPITSTLPETYGTNSQWGYALGKFEVKNNWAEVVSDEFGGTTNLTYLIYNFNTFDNDRKWLYFIALKLYGVKDNKYLNSAVFEATDYENFIRALYRHLLGVEINSKTFLPLYNERKKLLKTFLCCYDEINEFCKVVMSKGKNALYYITDNSRQEKELIITLLDRYCFDFEQVEIEGILKVIYPDLYSYLSPYRFDNTLLYNYFQTYKYEKVINKILPEFEVIVNEQAIKREYNTILQPRVSRIEKIDKTDCQLYFVDAMGVEYLGFILAKCREKGLLADITVLLSELPSITCMNKEFIDTFASAGCPVIGIKELDEIKHHGKEDFDYQTTKIPIHLIRELEIIDEMLDSIKIKLTNGTCKKVIMISDHGASRLAVIHETENKYEMSTKGKHSGRCCPKSDIDTKPDYATEGHGFWVLANYDRFKGGRKANFEVHGGATLEEVTIPIIEITCKSARIEAFVLNEYKQILISFRKKAMIKLYIGAKLSNINICIDNKYYKAVPTEDEFIYQVDMPDIKKVQTYIFDLLAGDNLITSGLSFDVKKEGSSENSLFEEDSSLWKKN